MKLDVFLSLILCMTMSSCIDKSNRSVIGEIESIEKMIGLESNDKLELDHRLINIKERLASSSSSIIYLPSYVDSSSGEHYSAMVIPRRYLSNMHESGYIIINGGEKIPLEYDKTFGTFKISLDSSYIGKNHLYGEIISNNYNDTITFDKEFVVQ